MEKHNRFYGMVWYEHLRFLLEQVIPPQDQVLIVVSSLGTKSGDNSFSKSYQQAVSNIPRANKESISAQIWNAESDPLLWTVDYFAWALQRKWERNDLSAYEKVSQFIFSEFDLFAQESHFYYERGD